MYGIFTYIYHKNQLNVGKYATYGSYGQAKKNAKHVKQRLFDVDQFTPSQV